MATNVDKSVYTAPQGLDALQNVPEMDVEVVDDDTQPGLEADGSMVVDLSEGRPKEIPEETEFGANLAEDLDDEVLLRIVSELDFEIDNDKRSRTDWEKTYKDGLNLLGLKIEERTEPWNGACGIVHPMITEAVVRFQAEMATETFPAAGPVKSKIIGLETKKKKEAAARVEADMNYELTECMPEFRPEHERLLFELPAVGCAFKKVYYDPGMGRQVSMFVSAEDVLLPYGTSDISTCYRVTHVLRRTKDELLRSMESGFYRELDLNDAPRQMDDVKQAKDGQTGASDINDDRFILHECHVHLHIPEDPKHPKGKKSACPYVVTYIKDTGTQVLSIRRNWREDDENYVKRQHFVQYNYVPGLGTYGYGLFHLIGGYAKGATSILRQLVDAGTLSNLPGGLKARGLRIKGDDTPIAPGEFRDVDIGSGTIKDNILPLPYKEPSVVLGTILEKIIEDARRFAATADLQISDMSSQAPVGTTLAILERQLKTLTAVQARVHYSLKQEFKLLKEIIRDYTPDEYGYDPETGIKSAKKSDYDLVEVIPVSDPNAATLSQRVVTGQTALQMAQFAPEVYDMAVLHREMLETLGIKNADKIVPLPDDMKPQDPVTENMNLLKSKPVKAFIYQDHMAHIAVHKAAMQDPLIMQAMGQNPKAPMIMAAACAHIAEHLGYQHRQQIEARLGITLPPEGQNLPPQIEAALSSMMAQAAQEVLSQNQAMAAVQAAQAAQNDPLLQLQMQELQIKKQDSDTKTKKVVGDLAAKADELNLREKELQLKGVQAASDIVQGNQQMHSEQMLEGLKTGVDVAKSKREDQRAQVDQQHQHQLAQADQEHRHRMDERMQAHTEHTGEQQFGLENQKFQADTAHKAHQAVVSQNSADREHQLKQQQHADSQAMQQEQNVVKTGMETDKMNREDKRAQMMAKQKAAAAKKTAKKPAAAKKVVKK